MPAWLVWLILAGVFAGGEALSGTFVLLMMSGGAVGGAVAAAIGGPLLAQVIVAIVVTVGLVWLVRPVAVRHAAQGQLRVINLPESLRTTAAESSGTSATKNGAPKGGAARLSLQRFVRLVNAY